MDEEQVNILPTYMIWLEVESNNYKDKNYVDSIIKLAKEDIYKKLLLQKYGFTDYNLKKIEDEISGKLYELLFVHPKLNFQVDIYVDGLQIRRNIGFENEKQYMKFINIINYVLEKILELILGEPKSRKIEFLAIYESYMMLCLHHSRKQKVKGLVSLGKLMEQYNIGIEKANEKNKSIIISKQDEFKITSAYYRLVRNSLFAKSIEREKPSKGKQLFVFVGHGRNFFFRKPDIDIVLEIGEKSKEYIMLSEEIELGSEIYSYDYFTKGIENNIVMGYLNESQTYLKHQCKGDKNKRILVDHAYHTISLSMQKIGETTEKISTILSIREIIQSINHFMYVLYTTRKNAYHYFKTNNLLTYKPLMMQIR